MNCLPRDQSLSDSVSLVAREENLFRVRAVFAGNSALLPSDIIDLAILPAQRFWRETVSLLDVM